MNIAPKKSLGQNFLRAPAVARSMAETACPNGDEIVLEIGPGDGMLTDALLLRAKKVIAIEKDARLIAPLKTKYAREIKSKKLTLIEGDALLESAGRCVGAKQYVVAANIPYYITGAIIRHLFSEKVKPKRIVLLVQKEVAERILARKSKPFDSARGKESILSISVKAYGVPRMIRKVPAGAFHPKPSVDSAVIAIEHIRAPFSTRKEEERFFAVLKRGFAHKRKLLRRNLGISGEMLSLSGIPPDARPENVQFAQWLLVSKISA